jgi:NAD(P)-dependent dehydrogenase (short-subunit alcohol dehydrogenase family)
MLKHFDGRTAVVTGAASGIGLAIAQRCRQRGMRVALLDVEQGALERAAAAIGGGNVLAVHLDIANAASVESAAQHVREVFGPVQLLCNNAGVSLTGPLWEHPAEDWDWVVAVNLLGVGYGIRAFVPAMVAGGGEGHIVNTASFAGLAPLPNTGIYSATKAAVVALSEALLHDLRQIGSPLGVSVLCPGMVRTNIVDSERNRPTATGPVRPAEAPPDPARADEPGAIADLVLRAAADDEFYVLTNPAAASEAANRAKRILDRRHPEPPDFASMLPAP